MEGTLTKGRLGINANVLKILAAVTMTIDHIGYLFFPGQVMWRYIGRLAFPIFAFMIAEGCYYTRNRLRYLVGVLVLGLVCTAGYWVSQKRVYLPTPMSFAMSIGIIWLLQAFYRSLWQPGVWKKLLFGAAFAASIAAAYWVCRRVTVEYGFWGCMLAVAAALPRVGEGAPRWLKALDRNPMRVLCMLVPLSLLAIQKGAWQQPSLLVVPILLCYNGLRGKWRLKYFYYIFYPSHLTLLYGLRWLINQ